MQQSHTTKQCPVCGEFMRAWGDNGSRYEKYSKAMVYYVECDGCGVRGASIYNTEIEAIKAWDNSQ